MSRSPTPAMPRSRRGHTRPTSTRSSTAVSERACATSPRRASVVAVAVENAGNVRLKPLVTFALLDAAGGQVSQASVQMDSFYAHTRTFAEVPLAALLLPGIYTVRLTLDDVAQDVRADATAIALVVEAPAAAAAGEGAGAGLTEVIQAPSEGQTSLALLGLVLVLGLVLGGLAIGLLMLVLRHRRRTKDPEW